MRNHAGVKLYDSLTDVREDYIEEAGKRALFFRSKRKRQQKRFVRFALAAAALALCLIVSGSLLFAPGAAGGVTAYAYGVNQEISSAGANLTTGKLLDSGELQGHPLLFQLSGEKIGSVRFSCEREQINFMDLTQQREEFGTAQNFTVSYGKEESEYAFLLVDWVPGQLIAQLRSGRSHSIQELPKELRSDRIVMEIRFLDGRTQVKAIDVSLNDDGSFHAVFGDYEITQEDAFVRRSDSEPIPRGAFYESGQVTVKFCDQNGEEVPSIALWYPMARVDHIVVQWNGRFAEMVQMFYTPAGTETMEEMELLATKVSENAENQMIFSAEPLLREELMGHLDFLIDFGGGVRVRSEQYNVTYDL